MIAQGKKKKRLPRSFSIPGMISLLISVIGVGALATIYGIGRYDTLIRDTRINMLFNATLTAQGLDANLKIADLVLENFDEDFSTGRLDITEMKAVTALLVNHAHIIGVADNVYLLDSDWKVIATAFERIEPSLNPEQDLRSRFRTVGGAEPHVVDCPAEGGDILALIRSVECRGRRYYLAALFSGFDIAGRLEPLRNGGRGHITLQDRRGNILYIGKNHPSHPVEGDAFLEASASFPSYPVKVMVSAARDEVLAPWFAEVRLLVVVILVSCAAILAAAFFITVLQRRRLQVNALEDALQADTTLFREINHRIKNNLVVVESVLDLGVAQYEDGSRSARQILESAKDRVHSISLVHELLYKGKDTKNVVLEEYVTALSGAIGDAYDPENRIERESDIDGTMELSFDVAVPCGMILSELLTNSYKYAFPGGREGSIKISAKRAEGDDVELVVSDDGVGFAEPSASGEGEQPDSAISSGLGTMLVSGLADQLRGSIKRAEAKGNGVCWVLRFPVRA